MKVHADNYATPIFCKLNGVQIVPKILKLVNFEKKIKQQEVVNKKQIAKSVLIDVIDDIFNLKCNKCDQRFTVQDTLTRHLRVQHNTSQRPPNRHMPVIFTKSNFRVNQS